MREFAVSAIGPDRPGIVASLTRCLLDHGVNAEDAQMTVLKGRFTMVLLGTGPEAVELGPLREELERTGERIGLDDVALTELRRAAPQAADPTHAVMVHGSDHRGIVHAVSETLAVHEVNITDLNGRVLEADDEDEETLSAMMIEVTLPDGMSADALDALLEPTRREEGLEITVRTIDADES